MASEKFWKHMSNKESFSWELYNRAPIVGIVRGVSMGVMRDIAKAYQQAGLHNIEITMNTPGAAQMISMCETNFSSSMWVLVRSAICRIMKWPLLPEPSLL